MTKKDTELPVSTSFLKTDIISVTTGVAAMTPVTTQIETEDLLAQLAAWRVETVVIELYGFGEEPEVGVIEGITFSMPSNYIMLGLPSLAIQDEQGGVASSSGVFELDILKNGVSILSTNITIDEGELNTSTAAIPPVVSDDGLDAFDQYTFEVIEAGVDVVGPMLLMFELQKV